LEKALELFKLNNVSKTFRMDGDEIHALKNVSVTFDAGDMTVVLGPSGSGKSTLLTLLGGLSRPSEGDVEYRGRSLYQLPSAELAAIRNKSFGFVFQFHYLMPELSALENVMLPCRIQRIASQESAQRAEELLCLVGLKDRMDHKPGEMSGGEAQRVAVARALVNRPEVVLADEPTGNLDIHTAEGIHDILWKTCQKEGRTLIVVTHYEPLAKRADSVVTLNGGQLTKQRS
jgi:lipoprotein-releasing system ATP-binding protein